MIDVILGIGFAVLAVMLVILALSPDHVTRDDNPITGRLFAIAGAVVCLTAALGFIFGV